MGSGTGALKTDFTRTGKRSYKGAINDGINSVMRYYLNNLKDGSKQDSIDIFGDERDLSKLLLRSVAITFLVFVFMFITLLKKGGAMGRKVVSKPLLVPESALYD